MKQAITLCFAISLFLLSGEARGQGTIPYAFSLDHWNQVIGISLETRLPAEGKTKLYKRGSKIEVLHKSYRIGEKLFIKPLVPFATNTDFELYFHGKEILTFNVGNPSKRNYNISHIEPRLDTLPANQLKFEIFSHEVFAESSPYPYIHLVDQEGDSLKGTFLELSPPLFNEDLKSLTLWMDPGRIKRGLGLNLKFDTPLEEGKQYELRISKSLRNKYGEELEEDYVKKFYVAAPDRTQPVPKLIYKRKSKLSSITVDFGEPMAFLSVRNRISLYKDGKYMDSGFRPDSVRRTWTCRNSEGWEDGNYEVRISMEVEDLAGNNLSRLFDEDLKKPGKDSQNENIYAEGYKSFNLSIKNGRFKP
ncbi:MAG: hypothetical protein MRZ79_07635 [Bacteroidia bacterium]|nr:hypothetical protein [Bacteroidia bacterium]